MFFSEKLIQPVIRWLNRETLFRKHPLCDFERIRHELKLCDVILIEGQTRVSEIIKIITQSPWSHAALYIGRLNDIEDKALRDIIKSHYQGWEGYPLVIESQLGMGTVIRPLTLYKNSNLRICRPSGLTHQDAIQVIYSSVEKTGTHYDVRQIFDLARFMFPWFIMPRRWRSSLFSRHAGNTTKTVCSTMIAEAFASIQFPILPLVKASSETGEMQIFRQNPKLCTPSDFDHSPYFEIIKYPYLDFHYQANYRLLPWEGNMQLTGQESSFYVDEEEENKQAPPPEPKRKRRKRKKSDSDEDSQSLH